MSLHWDNSLSTGIDNIDNEHKELFNSINKLVYVMKEEKVIDEVLKSLDLFEKCVIKHFNEEEAIMKQRNYPKFSLQHSQHEEFKNQLKILRNVFETTGVSSLFVITVQQKIAKWSRKHIMELDKDLGKFLIEKSRMQVETFFEKVN
jgi:hemerythrin